MIEIPNGYMKNLYRTMLGFLVILSIFFAVKVLSEFRNYKNADQGFNSITVYGHGEVSAVPDIANINFDIKKEAKTVKEAQEAVALVEKAALDFLKGKDIEEKDIKTVNASFNPKYEYRQKICPQVVGEDGVLAPTYCGGGKQVLVGYESYESISVKVRNVDATGEIMKGLGDLGVSNLNGPNFAIDDEDVLQAQARKDAIDDAKVKAKILSKDLGVRLGKIISFGDNGNYPTPMYFSKDAMMAGSPVRSSSAEIPKGENMISSDVTITFEIR